MLDRNHSPVPALKGPIPVIPFDRACVNDSSYTHLLWLKDAPASRLQTLIDANGTRTELLQQQQCLYDDLGRVMQAIGGAGQTTSVSYNANSLPTNTLDGNNSEWQQGYDALERLVVGLLSLLHHAQFLVAI